MEVIRGDIESSNHDVVSGWHRMRSPRLEVNDPRLKQRAMRDLADIREADIVIAFLGSDGSQRGGRHFELGYAVALRRPVWLVGKIEHAFHTLVPECAQYENWEQCLAYLGGAWFTSLREWRE